MFFSIITVCFNSEKTIERTIQSVLSQSFGNYEYIIIDGASSDKTLEIVDKYRSEFSHIKVVSEPDAGIYNAMNKGIIMADGDYIGIINSDDWYEKDTLQMVYDSICSASNPENSLFSGWLNLHFSDNLYKTIPSCYERLHKFSKKCRMGLHHPSTFVPAKIYKTIGLFDEKLKLYADCEFVNRCFRLNCSFIFINNVLANMSDGGASKQFSKQELIDSKAILSKYSRNKFDYFNRYSALYLRRMIKKFFNRIKVLKL